MKGKIKIFSVVLVLFLLFGGFYVGSKGSANSSYPYVAIYGSRNLATNESSATGKCEKDAVVIVNGKLLNLSESGGFSTKLNLTGTNHFVIATPDGRSLYISLNTPEMPSKLIRALPLTLFSFNTKNMVLNFGGLMRYKPAGGVTGYVSNDANNESVSFVVKSNKTFNSRVPLSFGNNVIHSYAKYLHVIKFTVPDFSVDFEKARVLKLKINSPYMFVDGKKTEVDLGRGTKPVILQGWDRTLLPVRAVAEGLGGKVSWDEKERKVTINLGNNNVQLWIDNPIAEVNGKKVYIDPSNRKVKPTIINDRTMLPVRFVAESLGAYVKWYVNTREVLVIYPKQ